MPTTASFKKMIGILWISHFFMDFFTGIWPIYKTLAQIDVAQAGIIAGVTGFFGEIFQLFFGYMSDKGHRKKVMILGLILASSILWVTFVHQISHYFIFLALLMLGSGSYHPAAAGMAGNLTRTHKGRYILLYVSGGALGLATSQLIFTKLLSSFNGHAWIMLVPLAITILIMAFYKFPQGEATPSTFSWKSIAQRKKPLLILYFSQVANYGLMLALLFLMPDLLRSRECHNWLCMGGGHFLFVIGFALALVPTGYLIDKYSPKTVMLVTIFMACLLLYLFLFLPQSSWLLTGSMLVLLGMFLGPINAVIVSWGNRLVPESPSTVSALLMGCAWCLSNLGPTSAGLLATRFSEDAFTNTIGVMGTLLIAIFFLILSMPKPEPVALSPAIEDQP